MSRREAAAMWLWANDGLPSGAWAAGVGVRACDRAGRVPSSVAMEELREVYRTKADQLLATIDAAERT